MPNEIPPAIRSRCLEVFFRELEKDELKTVAKTAADKIEKNISEEGLDLLTSYTRNGREAVNMIQIAAGMAVTENRKDITIEDIEWVIHSSQLTPKHEQKIGVEPQVGIVNGLAVYGPNSGSLLEIEVSVTAAQDKGSINITGIAEEESIGSQSKSIRRKSMAKGSVENVLTVLRTMWE